MTGRFFWLVVTFIFILVGHLAYVLFFPVYKMEQKLAKGFVVGSTPAFVVLDDRQARTLFPAEDPSLLHAVCPFDISQGSVKIAIAPYQYYWSLSIYSQKGDSYFSINDRQSVDSNLKIYVRKSAEEEVDQEEKQRSLVADKTIIDSPSQKGWAVLRFQIYNEAARSKIADQMKNFTCERGEP